MIDGEDLTGDAERGLESSVTAVSSEHPTVAIHHRALRGHPAAVLIDRAREAELLVVGSRGHGGFAGAMLGSVSQSCTRHARCPVVVVRTEQ